MPSLSQERKQSLSLPTPPRSVVRKLPSPPQSPSPSQLSPRTVPDRASVSSLTGSIRPLPPIPRLLSCKECRSEITCMGHLLPLSKIPQNSRAFRGFNGKASLFTDAQHVNLSPPAVHLMGSGAHTMQELSCKSCQTYVGWYIVRAHNSSEKWKEGCYLLELENLSASMGPKPRRRGPSKVTLITSDSDESSLGSLSS